MRIGEALAKARGRAGLTVAEVSQRTRIKEAIIRGIEGEDYSACGGDFYARGNIRSIAQAVGTDPESLIREYDAVHRAPGALSAVSLEELLAPAQAPGRRRRHWAVVLGVALLVAAGFGGYFLLSGPPHAASPSPAAADHVVTNAGQNTTPPAPKPSRKVAGHGASVVVQLTAIRSGRVVFSTPGGRYLFRARVAAGASTMWTFWRAVEVRLDSPGGVKLAVDGKNPLPHGAARPVTLILRPGRPAAVAVSPRHTPPARTLTGQVATVRAYIAAINDHHYARAWHLGGQNAGGSYSGFVAGFATTAKDTLTIVSVSGDVVTARLAAQQTDGSVNTYQGTYTVHDGVIIGFDVIQTG